MVRFDHIMKRLFLMFGIGRCMLFFGVLSPSLQLGESILQAMPKSVASKSPALRARRGTSAKEKAPPPKVPSRAHAKAKEAKDTAKANANMSLPIHFDPADPPICSSCTQTFGKCDKDALPRQVPLKWRIFNVKTIQQVALQGFRRP